MKNILVVDDDALMLLLIARYLDYLPIRHTVLTAANGADAIKVIMSTKVDLVVTDLNMPVMDGFTLLAYVADKHPDMKAIAMTGLQREDLIEKLSVLGVSHCLEKPFSLKVLIEKILQMLGIDAEEPASVYSAQQDRKLNSASIRPLS